MKKFRNISALLFLIGQCATMNAQSSILVSGGNASGSGATVSYTIGQLAYLNNSGISGTVAEGVQQPFEISVITGYEVTQDFQEISVYPNPSADFIILKIKDNEASKLNYNYSLYGLNGNLLQKKSIDSEQAEILMGSLKPGTYLLKIFRNNRELKAFKIIKK